LMFAVRLICLDAPPNPDLYWFHGEDRFVYEDGPRTLYETELEAEGGILWVIGRKGADYMGRLDVVHAESETRAL